MNRSGEPYLGSGTGSAFRGVRIVLLERGNIRKIIPLTGEKVVVGRGDECGLILADEHASRQHAQIALHGQGLSIEDMHSLNGTRVNERNIHLHLLNAGDLVRVGHTSLVYLTPGMPLAHKDARAVGWLTVSMADKTRVRLPVSAFPLLIGRAPEVDIRLEENGAPDFRAQVVAVPGGAQLTDLTTQPPSCILLTQGAIVELGPFRLEYHESDRVKKKKPSRVRPTPSVSESPKPEELARLLESGVAHENAAVSTKIEPLAKTADSDASHRIGTCTITGTCGQYAGRSFPVTRTPILIGSDPDCAIRVTDDPDVTSRHASVVRIEGQAIIEDLGSKAGVYVDGGKIRRHPLRPGNVIRIGQSEFLVHL